MSAGYGSREVAKLLGLSTAQVRAYVRAGFLEPTRGPRGELRFSFQDLVLLRTAKGLVSARIPPRRVRSALRKLRAQLPEGRLLRGVHIRAEGDRIVVGDGAAEFEPSGQMVIDFGARELARKVAPLQLRREPEPTMTADELYERGCDLDEDEPAEAAQAYQDALELDPDHADAHVNLGRILHENDDTEAAIAHYRRALEIEPEHPTASFNLGVALEDLQLYEDAVLAYSLAVAADPACADAHYNLSQIYERRGDAHAALRHLRTYRNLVRS